MSSVVDTERPEIEKCPQPKWQMQLGQNLFLSFFSQLTPKACGETLRRWAPQSCRKRGPLNPKGGGGGKQKNAAVWRRQPLHEADESESAVHLFTTTHLTQLVRADLALTCSSSWPGVVWWSGSRGNRVCLTTDWTVRLQGPAFAGLEQAVAKWTPFVSASNERRTGVALSNRLRKRRLS
ncbi:unnamed protein product [Protopolystoma xenopodis]|uniref:Uncharacterized protein n=1 Tax=Protopolystoma xenopodis TaxID=117903 RepID=A0A448WQX3_9PLAT|nr:unnamed protein product [Protopolystoma xenopodis]